MSQLQPFEASPARQAPPPQLNRVLEDSTHGIHAELVGSDIATAAGLTGKGLSCEFDLCRKLVAAGHSPSAQIRFYRGDMLCMTYPSLAWGAGQTVEETDSGIGPPRRRKFRLFVHDRVAGKERKKVLH